MNVGSAHCGIVNRRAVRSCSLTIWILPPAANALKMSVRAALVDARRVSPGCSYPAMISTESVLEGSSINRIPFGKVAEESRIPKMVEMGANTR